MGYDPRCYELAESFLSDVKDTSEKSVAELAQVIQDTIDDWINFWEEYPKS